MEENTLISRRERRKLDTWHTIRQTAFQLIIERGYNNVTLDDIATAADVSRATLFNYFRSKDAMLFNPDPEVQTHWETFMAHRPVTEPIWITLEAFFLDFTAGYESKLRLQKQLQQDGIVLGQSTQGVSERLHVFLLNWIHERLAAQGQTLDEGAFLLGVAFTAMTSAFDRWDATQDFGVLQDLIQHAFQRAGRGLLTPP